MLEGIIESGNHYLIQVKRNQPSLFQELGDMLAERPLDIFEQTEKGHGRHSHWTVSVFDASGSPKSVEWKGLSRLIHVHKHTVYTDDGRESHSDRLYITDLRTWDAEYFSRVTRGHWAIENRLHWVKDVRHGEDSNRISEPNAAMNISICSSIALNLHRKNGREGIKKAQMEVCAKIGNIINEFRT